MFRCVIMLVRWCKQVSRNLLVVSIRYPATWWAFAKGLTAQAPATDATIPPEMTMGLNPRVLLKSMPLSAPAAMVLAASCLPRR